MENATKAQIIGQCSAMLSALVSVLGERLVYQQCSPLSIQLLLVMTITALTIPIFSAAFLFVSANVSRQIGYEHIKKVSHTVELNILLALLPLGSVYILSLKESEDMSVNLVEMLFLFGMVFLSTSLLSAIAAYIAAYRGKKEAADIARHFFSSCLLFGILLWLLCWLIS